MMQLSEQEYQDLYNKRAVMQTLKKGRTLRRNNTVLNVFYLAGFGSMYIDSVLSQHNPRITTKQRTTVHYIHSFDPCIINGFQKYLNNFEEKSDLLIEDANRTQCGAARRLHTYHNNIRRGTRVLTLHYNPSDVNWWLIDYDLLKYHNNNIRVDKKTNFVYIKDPRKNKHVAQTQKYL